MRRKPDDAAIGAFFDELAAQPWLGRQRQLWPRFFFHITSVQNAARILTDGVLLCRQQALATQRMASDNASPDILALSRSSLFQHARLYFRPRTPTFYRNEGIRPRGSRELGAHCPVPVALLFDSREVAGRDGVRFSNGNLASTSSELGDDIGFLRSLHFQDIYHDRRPDPTELARIITRRQAEIVVPRQLDLGSLRLVVTRSIAERMTLLDLIETAGDQSPLRHDTVRVDPAMFFGRWVYIEQVQHLGTEVRFLFNPDTEAPVLFNATFDWLDPRTAVSLRSAATLRALGNVSVPIPGDMWNQPLHLRVHLDDALAFSGSLVPLPFGSMMGS